MRGERINQVILTGEVVSDAVFGCTPRGTGVATFTLAFFNEHDERGKHKGTIDVVCMGDEVARSAGSVRRSTIVRVEGSLRQRSWKTPEGFYRSKTEIAAHSVESLRAGTIQETG